MESTLGGRNKDKMMNGRSVGSYTRGLLATVLGREPIFVSRLPRTVNNKIPTSRASCSEGKKKRDPGFEAEIFSNLTIKATQAYVRKTNNALRYPIRA